MSEGGEPAAKPPMSKGKRAGLIGAVVGVAAAGVAAGVAVERLVVRRTRRDDPYAEEPFGLLPFDETVTVETVDDLELHVEIVEPMEPVPTRPTIVFVHGFCLDQGTFHFQRKALDAQGKYRMVFYDQPGHGLSSALDEGEYELPALGDALADVIKAVVPTGPIVLIGHSMGGMAIMAYAEQHPQVFAERVSGVILIATSGGAINGSHLLGLHPLVSRAAPSVLAVINTASKLSGVIDRARAAGNDLAYLLTRRYGFGSEKPSPALVSYVERMNSRTTTATVARYLRSLFSHARYPALRALESLPVLLIVGEKDMVTPISHSAEIARLLPHATYLTVPDSGHMVMLEAADHVNEVIQEFLAHL
jgi:pimeloyl-ACP methyl ester carboxylesterase